MSLAQHCKDTTEKLVDLNKEANKVAMRIIIKIKILLL
jgi:hypothetical protein